MDDLRKHAAVIAKQFLCCKFPWQWYTCPVVHRRPLICRPVNISLSLIHQFGTELSPLRDRTREPERPDVTSRQSRGRDLRVGHARTSQTRAVAVVPRRSTDNKIITRLGSLYTALLWRRTTR